MTNTYYFEAPNTCGLLIDSVNSSVGSFVEGSAGIEVMCPDKYDTFFQSVSKEATLQKAVSLDSSYSKNTIYGAIQLDLIDSSPAQVTGFVNKPIILFCEYSSSAPGVLLTYQWIDPQGSFIPTATSNIFEFTPSSSQFSGTYTCLVSATGDYNWSGDSSSSFYVTVSQPLAY